MFQALATKRPRKTQITRISSVPAPVGGWNARDSYAAMGASDAVILENFFPLPYAVSLRKGFTEWVTGMTDLVETVLQYRPPTGNGELFAAAGANIYDVSASGAVGAAEVSALTSAQWQYINFSVGGTAYLYAVNGADKPLLYNGATWTPIDGASVPAVTGVTTTTLANINIHKTRVWFCENGTLKAWYLPTNAVGGAALALDLSNLCQRGGYLVTMSTWSYDNGRGMDDYAVFVTSEGEVIVYQGTDPASSATWSLVGVYAIGTPLGRRCAVKYGGDLLLITKDGVVPMSKVQTSTIVTSRATITDKIQSAVSEATTLYGANDGWQIQVFPPENMLLLNVPVSSTTQEQYVMNTITGAWCNFSGMAANCWELWNDSLYFGGVGTVYKAWTGNNDNGANIVGEALPAFNYFGSGTQKKRVPMVRPLIAADSTAGVLIGLNTDFVLSPPTGSPSFTPTTASVWDTATWDSGTWGSGELEMKTDWQSVFGTGFCAALHMIVETNAANLQWIATDYVIEDGGVV